MLTMRIKLLNGLDRLVAMALAALVLGTSLAFGGGVWWARPVVAGLTFALVLAWMGRVALAGPWRVLKSPLTALGSMALALAVVQMLPLPSGLVERVSCSSDARVSYARLTEPGYDKLREAGCTHVAGIRRLFLEHFDAEETQQLASLLSRLPGATSEGECTVGEDSRDGDQPPAHAGGRLGPVHVRLVDADGGQDAPRGHGGRHGD